MSIRRRKKEHLKLAASSVVPADRLDNRFNYEPLLSNHNMKSNKVTFMNREIGAPIFISSITGGHKSSTQINRRLATAAFEFKIPMGLGSIRPYIENRKHKSFDIRKYSGYDVELFGNIGIAQIENLLLTNRTSILQEAIDRLELNGIIIHVNPLQEWIQPGGDRFSQSPLQTLKEILPSLRSSVIIKEVGCGFGPESLKELLELPIDVIDLAGFGGTNFTEIEIKRKNKFIGEIQKPLINIGHTPDEMIEFINNLTNDSLCNKEFIISGGIKSFLDGYYYRSLLNGNSLYGYAGKLLKYALRSEKAILSFLEIEIENYNFAESFLNINKKLYKD